MTWFIRKYTNSCLQCVFRKGNHGNLEGKLHPTDKAAVPMHKLYANHLVHSSKHARANLCFSWHIFVYEICIYKSGKVLYFYRNIKLLKEILSRFGHPVRLITDRGKAFTNSYFKQFLEEMQLKHVTNAIARPRSNGQVERVNRTLLNGFNMTSEFECMWDTRAWRHLGY